MREARRRRFFPIGRAAHRDDKEATLELRRQMVAEHWSRFFDATIADTRPSDLFIFAAITAQAADDWNDNPLWDAAVDGLGTSSRHAMRLRSRPSGLRVEVAGPPDGGHGDGPFGSDQRAEGAHHRDPNRDHLPPACPCLGTRREDERGVGEPRVWCEPNHDPPLAQPGRRLRSRRVDPQDAPVPAMPNATPSWVVEELLAEAVVRPTLGAL